MDYYGEIKNKLLDNEIYSRVKDYLKERYNLITYYEVGKLLVVDDKHYAERIEIEIISQTCLTNLEGDY